MSLLCFDDSQHIKVFCNPCNIWSMNQNLTFEHIWLYTLNEGWTFHSCFPKELNFVNHSKKSEMLFLTYYSTLKKQCNPLQMSEIQLFQEVERRTIQKEFTLHSIPWKSKISLFWSGFHTFWSGLVYENHFTLF